MAFFLLIMHKLNTFLLLFILALIISVSGCNTNAEKKVKIKELESYKLIKDFGKGQFYRNIKDIVSAENNFILGGTAPSIIVLNENFLLQTRVAKEGRGPGEFTSLSEFEIKENLIYVLNAAEQKIISYTINGIFKNEIGLPQYTWSFAMDDQGYIYISSPYTSEFSITKIDHEGNVLDRFGSILADPESQAVLRNEKYLNVMENRLIVVYGSDPRISIYTLDGELLQTQYINHSTIEHRVQMATNYWAEFNPKPGVNSAIILFKDAETYKSTLYILPYTSSEYTLSDYVLAYNFNSNKDSLILKKVFKLSPVIKDEGVNSQIIGPIFENEKTGFMVFDLHSNYLIYYEN